MKSLSGNYRQIIDVKDVEICSLIDNIVKFPVFVQQVAWFNETFPGLVKKCPYAVSRLLMREKA